MSAAHVSVNDSAGYIGLVLTCLNCWFVARAANVSVESDSSKCLAVGDSWTVLSGQLVPAQMWRASRRYVNVKPNGRELCILQALSVCRVL